jgi:hypothetical protein
MCVGKTKEMAAYLGQNMASINKKYHAITVGSAPIVPKSS